MGLLLLWAGEDLDHQLHLWQVGHGVDQALCQGGAGAPGLGRGRQGDGALRRGEVRGGAASEPS